MFIARGLHCALRDLSRRVAFHLRSVHVVASIRSATVVLLAHRVLDLSSAEPI